MSLQATPGALVDLGSAVLLLALAGFVASVRPRRRANAAFAVFAGGLGAGFLAGNLFTSDDPLFPAAAAASGLSLLLAAAALLALAWWFPRPLPRKPGLAPALAAVAAAIVAWHARGAHVLRDCLRLCLDPFGDPGAFFLFSLQDGVLLAAFLVALVLLPLRHAAARGPGQARERRQLALMGLALLLYPGLRAGFDASAGSTPLSYDPRFVVPEVWTLQGLAVTAWLVVAAGLWLRATLRTGGAERRVARDLALLHAGLPLLGLLLAGPLGGWPAANHSGALGMARAASVLVLGYAMLRHQLLDIDLRLRRTVRTGTVAGVFLGAYVVVSVASQTLVDGTAATWLGISAAALLVLAILPLQRLADRVAERALPGGGDPGARSLALYRAALEQAEDGTAGDSKVLAVLRAELGISEREAAVMDAEVRAAAGQARGHREGHRVLGKYVVEAVLGQGGFGTTLLAWDERVERRVVLKIARVAGPGEAKRLLREARVLARLGHPQVLTCYDVEEVGGEVVLVLEYAEGGSLADRLRRGPLPWPAALRIADDVLAALQAAHARDILHRDVKPANILLTPEGRAKLADFGVARAPAGSGTVGGLTTQGNPGSVRYMSPEQVRGRPLDARSDLYSVAAVLVEAITGRPYLDFEGLGEFEARLAILEAEPDLRLPGTPKALATVLAACLAKDPALRPASAGEVRRMLAKPAKAPGRG